MDIVKELNDELLRQDFSKEQRYAEELEKCRGIAQGYAIAENALAVLSDMHNNISYMYYGGFAKSLGLEQASGSDEVRSIWEEPIIKLIHPDDLYQKYLQELRFFHFMKHLPKSRRSGFYHVSKLRMKDKQGGYIPVMHRIIYISASVDNSLWLSLCLYNPQTFDVPAKGMVVDSETGQVQELEKCNDSNILSEREKQVLRLIDRGMMSKHIAETLSISIHTVSRHRQAILEKLQVRSSIEACRVAKDLGIF